MFFPGSNTTETMNLEIDKIYLSNEFASREQSEEENGNTEVIVQLTNGERHVASFFTFKNIELIRKENKRNGTFLEGKYFWVKGMFLIDNCGRESISQVVDHLINEGEFFQVFRKL